MSQHPEIRTGTHGDHLWLTIADDLPCKLVRLCPDIVVGKYVLVASFDSSPFVPTASEIRDGWRQFGNVALSPIVASPDEVPYTEWGECYVFTEPPAPPDGDIEVFVNYGGFGPDWPDRRSANDAWDPTWDRKAECAARGFQQDLVERYWSQFERLGAESHFCDNGRESFTTRNRELYEEVRRSLAAGGE